MKLKQYLSIDTSTSIDQDVNALLKKVAALWNPPAISPLGARAIVESCKLFFNSGKGAQHEVQSAALRLVREVQRQVLQYNLSGNPEDTHCEALRLVYEIGLARCSYLELIRHANDLGYAMRLLNTGFVALDYPMLPELCERLAAAAMSQTPQLASHILLSLVGEHPDDRVPTLTQMVIDKYPDVQVNTIR